MDQESGAPAREQRADDNSKQDRRVFPIVGIGASAGGLEALRELFLATPPDIGAGYVIVQHLDPTHDSLMADLLTKYTAMRVVQVEDGMAVTPNVVHIIPPNTSLTIADGVLKLDRPVERRGMRMPIDLFLISLAEDQEEAAIGIVLSGTGSDGTYGIRAVKAHGGLVMVQEPSSARYDGMPRNAIATGDADYVLKPEEIPHVIRHYVELLRNPDLRAPLEKSDKDHLLGITALLLAREGYDFGCYKRGTLERRIVRRMGLKHIERLSGYHQLLRGDAEELKALSRDLLIGVTSFFREPEAWEILSRDVLTPLLQRHSAGDSVRVWVPGCATGEEAYSLAMLLVEAAERTGAQVSPQIFATDIAKDALDTARTGRYPESIEAGVSKARLRRFFSKDGDGYRVKSNLRESVIFAPQNLISDPPFSNLDLISCRNLLIYIEPPYQDRVLSLFHFALADGGYLMLGHSEAIGGNQALFRPLSNKWRIFRRVDSARPRTMDILFGKGGSSHRLRAPAQLPRHDSNFGQLTQKLLLNLFAPAAVLIDDSQLIQYFYGSVSDYLGLGTGEPTTQLLSLAGEGLRPKLRSVLHQASTGRRPVQMSGARVRRGKEWSQVRIAAYPLEESSAPKGMLLITFQDEELGPEQQRMPRTLTDDEDPVVKQLEAELGNARQELRTTIEQMETANEELQASNEEVMSMNEELQSSNEELETSKEELQSLNEELTTLNSQLEEKLRELEKANNDLQNLLVNTNIATIFIDRSFRIRRYTPSATALLNLIASDIGRELTDIAWRFSDESLLADAAKILQGQVIPESEVWAENGCWYTRRVMPYQTEHGAVEGVVITFVDITERREMEQRLRESEQHLRHITDALPVLISYVDQDQCYRFNNAAYQRWFGKEPADLLGKPVREILGAAAYAKIEPHIETALAGRPTKVNLELSDTPLGPRSVRAEYLPDVDEAGEVKGFFALVTDITDRLEREGKIKSLNRRLRQRVEEQEALFEAAPVGIFVARDAACADMSMNAAGARLLRLDADANPSPTGPQATQLPFRVFRGEQAVDGSDLPMQRAATEGRVIVNEEIEMRFVDGDSKNVSVHAAPLFDENARVRGCIGVMVDSTDYRRAIAALAREDERKDRFLAQLAHELRNPLTPLVVAADLLERQGTTPELLESIRDSLINQTRHLSRLVDDLLDAARVTHDRLKLRCETLDLRVPVRDAIETVRPEIEQHRHRFQVDLPDDSLLVFGDPTRLTQVFANLLKNAVHYTPEQGDIRLTAYREGDRVAVNIDDSGSGLNEEDLEQIFAPLARGEGLATQSGGLGLGLPLAKRIAELHDGGIEASSEGRGKGSRFTVALPAIDPLDGAHLDAKEPASTERNTESLRVLIVDDQKDVVDSLALLLRTQGHISEAVHHPDDVLPAIERFKPQVVLLDIGLPGRSGYDVAADLAGLGERSKMRVIALSGYAEDAAPTGYDENFDQRLLRPVRLDDLLEAITPE